MSANSPQLKHFTISEAAKLEARRQSVTSVSPTSEEISQGVPVVQLSGVSRLYGEGDGAVHALSAVDLEIRAGEFVVVLGPSGSGKTTLLNVIGALDSLTQGQIVVGGVDITQATRKELARFRRHTVSFIFQTFNLFPGLTALENVQFGADVSGRHGATAAEVMERVGLGERLHNFQHQLSGGEQQRVAIARALATGNPILLADEPTGELDFRTGVQILELLHEQTHELDTAVLVVTHNREISRMADRVVELSSGRVISDGLPAGGRAEISELRW
jgi:putative ABC transport system ATP-binding protein